MNRTRIIAVLLCTLFLMIFIVPLVNATDTEIDAGKLFDPEREDGTGDESDDGNTNCNPFDEQKPYPQVVTEDFESGSLPESVAASGADLSLDQTNTGTGTGALCVTPVSDSHSVFVMFGGKGGIRYHIGFLEKNANLSKLQIKIWVKTTDGNYISQTVETTVQDVSDNRKKVSGDFLCTTDSAAIGYIEICSSDTSSYLLDEITVTPEFNSSVIKEGNIVQYSSFDSQDEISHLYANPQHVTLSLGEGVAGTSSSLRVVANGKFWANVNQNADIRIGRKYKVSFWAKANDAATAGLPIQLVIDRTERTHIAAPQYVGLDDPNHRTIQSTWTKYELVYQCTTATTDTCLPQIYFRVGTQLTDVLDYCVDELVIEELPDSYEVDVNAQLYEDIIDRSAIIFSADPYLNSVGAWYRLCAPFGDEYVIVKSGYVKNGESIEYLRPEPIQDGYKVEYIAVDAWGLASSAKEIYLSPSKFSKSEIIRINYDTSVWIDDMHSLDATVSYQGGETDRYVFASIALYDDFGRLFSVKTTPESVYIQAQRTTEFKLSIKNNKQASKSKVFLWDVDSLAPIKATQEFTKTTYDNIFFVDPENGSVTSENGTFQEPYKTISQARTKVLELTNNASASGETQDIAVVLMPGTYEGLDFSENNTTPSDNVNVTYVSYKPGEAVISAGKQVTGFTLHDAQKNIYKASLAGFGTVAKNSRQIYINGVRAVRARSNGTLENCANPAEFVNGSVVNAGVGVTTTDTSLLNYQNINELELVFFEDWTNPRYVVESASFNQETQLVTLKLNETMWNQRMYGNHTIPSIPEYYENAYELLDEGGEFYINKSEEYLYYIPREYEDMSTAEVIVPDAESLMTIKGTADNPMKNITFDGISFQYATWTAPNTYGFIEAGQNNIGITGPDEDVKSIPGAIELTNVHNVNFYNCKFSKVGQTAVKMTEAIQNCDFVGNEISDASGGAIFIGDPDWIYARAPHEEKYYQINNNVTDNYIHDISLEFRSGAAISAAFPKNMNICNNEVFSTPYSGVHTGWGWDDKSESGTVNLKINNNYFHKILNTKMFDGGAVYTLGHTGGSLDNLNEICGNYCYDSGNMWGVLYPDQGASYWLIDYNVIDQTQHPVWVGKGAHNLPARWTHIHTSSINNIVYGDNNYSTTAEKLNNGTDIQYRDPHVYPTADWPEEALAIIHNAGVREPYRDNFDFGLQEVYLKTEVEMKIGETKSFPFVPTTGKMVCYDIEDITQVFKSDNPDVVSINKSGVMTAQAYGTANITVTLLDNEIERSFTSTVVVR